MKDFLSSLSERTAEFGNHYRKYIQAVSKYLDPLIQKLEEKKKRDFIHIIHPAYDFSSEIKVVADIGETNQEKLNFLGTFFALQFLLMNCRAIDMLRMDIMAAGVNKFTIYKDFMRNVGNTFRMLTANYIRELLNVLINEEERPEFVILGVGTKSDQDDIDVGIIDDGTKTREKFNRAIASLSQQMLKFATSFHFHLSEHIGSQHYSASIEEYKKILKQEIRDFVIINEMLGGAIIIGNEQLFAQYRKEIIGRYFYHPDGDNKYHEGYLRGILGEGFSLLTRPISSTHINFKEDALRIIKSIFSAQKTVFGVEKVNAWDILDDLRTKNAKRAQEYDVLERSLTFFEIFRYLYQLFVTQDEEIFLDDVALKNIRKIARLMGYSDIGKCRAEDHLLVHYYEYIQAIRSVVPRLLEDIKSHLKLCSIFVPMFNLEYPGNIARDFIQKFKFFRGTSFWNDILDDFMNEDILKRFVDDLNVLPSDERKEIIKKYIEWISYDFYSLIKFLTILGNSKNSFAVYEDLNNHLLKAIHKIPDAIRNIAYVFYRHPNLINNYLSLNKEKGLNFYLQILETKFYEEEIKNIIGDLKNLIKIHLSSSPFFKRYFLRMLNKYPECIQLLSKPPRLKEFADGIYSDVSSMRTFEAKKDKLGDYYDFEMMRVGINTLQGTPVQITNIEFIAFSDQYINTLFDICRQEIDTEYPKRMITEDILAIFTAGGHAREQAYDDDYDIIVLLNSKDPEVLPYCNRIIAKMNAEIIKRGTIPHHRFAENFGRFVIRFDEIEQLLSEERADIFIEKSQVLGARLIIGSHRFAKEFFEKVVKPHIFDKKSEYIKQMMDEIKSRHMAEKESLAQDSNIKEGIGGLRDVEMMMLIIKAQFNIKEPVNAKLFEAVALIQDSLKEDLQKLANAFTFLKNLRDVYRLTAGATDTIMLEALNSTALIMGYKNSDELYTKFKDVRAEVEKTISKLINRLA